MMGYVTSVLTSEDVSTQKQREKLRSHICHETEEVRPIYFPDWKEEKY